MLGEEFETVYEEHFDAVLNFFRYRVVDELEAEDLTQRTFEKAWVAWKRFDSERASAKTWLLAIGRNVWIDSHRSSRSVPVENEVLERIRSVETTAPIADPGPSPELAAALCELTPRAREVLALRYGADLSVREVAKVMDISLAAAQKTISRSLRKLERSLGHVEAPAPRTRSAYA